MNINQYFKYTSNNSTEIPEEVVKKQKNSHNNSSLSSCISKISTEKTEPLKRKKIRKITSHSNSELSNHNPPLKNHSSSSKKGKILENEMDDGDDSFLDNNASNNNSQSNKSNNPTCPSNLNIKNGPTKSTIREIKNEEEKKFNFFEKIAKEIVVHQLMSFFNVKTINRLIKVNHECKSLVEKNPIFTFLGTLQHIYRDQKFSKIEKAIQLNHERLENVYLPNAKDIKNVQVIHHLQQQFLLELNKWHYLRTAFHYRGDAKQETKKNRMYEQAFQNLKEYPICKTLMINNNSFHLKYWDYFDFTDAQYRENPENRCVLINYFYWHLRLEEVPAECREGLGKIIKTFRPYEKDVSRFDSSFILTSSIVTKLFEALPNLREDKQLLIFAIHFFEYSLTDAFVKELSDQLREDPEVWSFLLKLPRISLDEAPSDYRSDKRIILKKMEAFPGFWIHYGDFKEERMKILKSIDPSLFLDEHFVLTLVNYLRSEDEVLYLLQHLSPKILSDENFAPEFMKKIKEIKRGDIESKIQIEMGLKCLEFFPQLKSVHRLAKKIIEIDLSYFSMLSNELKKDPQFICDLIKSNKLKNTMLLDLLDGSLNQNQMLIETIFKWMNKLMKDKWYSYKTNEFFSFIDPTFIHSVELKKTYYEWHKLRFPEQNS